MRDGLLEDGMALDVKRMEPKEAISLVVCRSEKQSAAFRSVDSALSAAENHAVISARRIMRRVAITDRWNET